jgi:uncharacterized membrane protein
VADRGSGEVVVDAPVEDVWQVVCDLATYPSWAADIKDVSILTVDDAGLPETVDWRVGGFGVTVAYTLRYEHEAPRRQGWSLVRSGELRRMDGEYRLEALDGRRTRVTYLLEVDLRIPVLGMIKRRAERTIVDHALRGLQAEVERRGRTR